MFILALCGMHGSGKSQIGRDLETKGWLNINKRVMLRQALETGFFEPRECAWESWYKKAYQELGAHVVLRMLFDYVEAQHPDLHQRSVVLDALHNPEEWDFVQQLCHSELVLVTAPRAFREQRLKETNTDVHSQDLSRSQYIHRVTDGRIRCLYSEVGWSICNHGSLTEFEAQIEALVGAISKG